MRRVVQKPVRNYSRAVLAPVLIAGLLSFALPATVVQAAENELPALLPAVGNGTNFLDHEASLAGFADPEWYEANVPFVDLPDQTIEDTYYYRWRTFKEALKYTGPDDGWIVSEFLGPVGYAAPGGAISAAAGHHLYEGRWLRDERYLDDYVDYWLTGAGASAKPANEGLGKDTTDWAHQYSFWVADAVLAKARVTGRLDEAAALLPELEKQWKKWSPQFSDDLGLYWQTPVWDAMEYTASSYQSDDPYHGGDGYRPTLNAYQYGDAMAISELARLTGDDATADEYAESAARLEAAQEKYLWDADDQFYKHVMRDDNPTEEKIADREQIGYIPWYFHMAPAENDDAWAQLLDPQGFAAAYGPTTVERRSPWYMKDAESGCCRWDGPSWPFATSQTLTALGNLLADYPAQEYVDADDFTGLLHDYAATQRKNGQPYVAEAHHPDENRWLYDGTNHSEDYNHSTFNDIVLSSLIGIRSQDDDSVRIDPQVASDWDHFAAENVPYHGHNLTVLWDEDGSYYGATAGLSVYQDGELIHTQPALGPVTVPFGGAGDTSPQLPGRVDDSANQSGTGFPRTTASYSWRTDPPTEATDGQEFQLDIPSTRWTTYQTPNATDWLRTDFGVPTPVSDVRTVFYSDGGGVRLPDNYSLEYLTASGDWQELPGQSRSPANLVAGSVSRVTLDEPVITTSIRLVGTNHAGSGFGVTSFGSWRSLDDGLTAQLGTRADGVIAVAPGSATPVTATVTVSEASAGITDESLFVPQGWTAERTSPSLAGVGAGTYRSEWLVTAPANSDATADTPIRFVVDSASTHLVATDVAPATWIFDPATFGTAVWDDDFSANKLANYTVSGSLGEPVGATAVDTASAQLAISSTARSRSLLRVPVDAGESFAIIVEPKSFSTETGDENSLFIGAANGPDDIAMSWFNKNKSQGGVNVVTGGTGHGDAEGAGAASVVWEPGDRFATVIEGGRLTSWIDHDGVWTRLSSAPVKAAIPESQLATWAPAFSVRLDGGTVSLDRVTVLRGGSTELLASTTSARASTSMSYGSALTVTASVASAAGSPTGTVTVLSGAKALASAPLVHGSAAVKVPKLALRPGGHTLRVEYSGDARVAPSSTSRTITVKKAKSTTRSSFVHSTVYRAGKKPVVRVTVSAAAPVGGTVSIREGSRVLVTSARLVGGKATITISKSLSKGLHHLVVTYSGSGTVATSSDTDNRLRVK